MIKREHLKQAIDAIAKRDAEIGYTLDEMLSSGFIDSQKTAKSALDVDEFHFLFGKEKIPVKRFIFFNDGTAGIEQQLLIKYGELVKTEELRQRGHAINYQTARDDIHRAGLRFLVIHEIDFLINQLSKQIHTHDSGQIYEETPDGDILLFLESIKQENPLLNIPDNPKDSSVIFQGEVDTDVPALFMHFPYCMDALMQIADMNLEFFHVRFVLGCLAKQLDKYLFVCGIQKNIGGLVFISFPSEMIFNRLEIKYIASLQNLRIFYRGTFRDNIKGIGTFLIAGLWLFWKKWFQNTKEISLDSEIGANRFYESIGFSQRRFYEYVLKDPKGYLPSAILKMAERDQNLDQRTIAEINTLVKKQVRYLRKKPIKKKTIDQRKQAIHFVQRCLVSKTHPEFTDTAIHALHHYSKRIPEASDLLWSVSDHPLVRVKQTPAPAFHPLAVVNDTRFAQHLASIFHLESAKRIQTIDSLLQDPSIYDKWISVQPRMASPEELMWIHTPDHVERIAQTAGKPLTSLDLDTQTTEKSFEVACLSAGAVFSLLDTIMDGTYKNGFAFVRPPGHHAEPNKAMGFCIFNNIALGAKYLSKHYQVKKTMIIDIDAHHGNGTQKAFYDTDEVLFISAHQFPAYPGTGNIGEVGHGKGEGYNINIPLAKGCGDKEYEHVIQKLIEPIAREYHPEIILVSFGFDLYMYDRLAGMNVTPEGYAGLTHLLMEIAESNCEGRMVFILEGGYSIKGIEACGIRVLQELCGCPSPSRAKKDMMKVKMAPSFSQLRKVIEVQRKYWKNLYPP